MIKPVRCAVYTRKSSEEGLEQDFNSLHAQREACEAFITSQKHEGWKLIKTAYDDAGISGGTMVRPALQQLFEDIKAKKVDVIVVYKVDRLTRSLPDFARMVELFDQHNVSFVSITQQFNTTTSMGRLTLNVLLSFAQFEREVAGERIRDKITASKRKGMFMGGPVPLGYEVRDRKLLIIHPDADLVRRIYGLYIEIRSVWKLKPILDQECVDGQTVPINGSRIPSPGISRGRLYSVLTNPIYTGKIVHKDLIHNGLHEPIIEQSLWDEVQKNLKENARLARRVSSDPRELAIPKALKGKLFVEGNRRLTYSYSNVKGIRYAYYITKRRASECRQQGWRLPSKALEETILRAIRKVLCDQKTLSDALAVVGLSQSSCLDEMLNISKAYRGMSDRDLLANILEKICFSSLGFTLSLNLRDLCSDSQTRNTMEMLVTHFVPMVVRRRGNEMRLVVRDAERPLNPNPNLIKVIGRAHIWLEEWSCGKVKGVREIAEREGKSVREVSDIIKLATLAPDIVEDIIAGRQPVDMSVDNLTSRIDIPLFWESQKRRLGFG